MAALLEDGGVPEVEALDDFDFDAAAAAAAAAESELGSEAANDSAAAVSEEGRLAERKALAQQAAEEAAARRARVPVPSRRRRLTPAQLRAAALVKASGGAAATAAAAAAAPSAAPTKAQQAPGPPQAAAAAPSAPTPTPTASTLEPAAGPQTAEEAADLLAARLLGGDDAEDEDELDWDALGRFEEFEAAARREREQQELQQRRRAAQAQAQAQAAAAAPVQQQQQRPAATPRQPPAAAPAARPGAAGAAAAATAAAASSSPLDRDLAELEGLLGFFERLEEGGGAGGAAAGSGKAAAGGKAAAALGSALDADDVDWADVEAALFGEGWQRELMAELEAELGSDDDDEEDAGADGEAGGRAAVGGGGDGDDDAEPWADDVTALLLGLVETAHQKYLDAPLLAAPASEDERAAAVWAAPFALLVLDDSREQRVEYANAAAEALLGRAYLDVFGAPGHELAAPDAAAQADWAFALRDADESFKRCAVVPRLALAGAGGKRAVARDAAVFRVDSLEGTPIGQAVLIRDWAFEN